MTGLDVEREHIIEMACIITDENLTTIAEVYLNYCFFVFLIFILKLLHVLTHTK